MGWPRFDREKWKPGKVIEVLGSLHYAVDFDGKIVKRHIDQAWSCAEAVSGSTQPYELADLVELGVVLLWTPPLKILPTRNPPNRLNI